MLRPALVLAALALLASGTPADAQQRPPNIVLIITDDQGYGDLGFYGNPDVQTPTLDRLARESTRLAQFYVSPVCAPTRASLMTGRHSLRTGVYDTYNGGAIMATEEVTLAELLQDAGYATGIFGKWHLGDAYPSRPQDQGFAETLVHAAGGMGQVGDVHNYFDYDRSYFDPTLLQNGVPVQTEGYCSDVFTDGALRFIEAHAGEPFFLYLSFNAPHTPLQVPDTYAARYADLTFDPARYPDRGQGLPSMTARDAEAARRIYAMVSNIDDNVGRLRDRLGELRLADDTVLIFMTDNGPQQTRYTYGLRGRKGTVYEGGIRVPFFLHAPGRLPADQDVTVPAAHIDVLPTLLGLAGLAVPDTLALDGRDLGPALRGETPPWAERPLFFHWQRGLPEPYRNVAVRQGAYKLVGHVGDDAGPADFELFDLAADPYEARDLSADRPDVAARLKATFDAWLGEVLTSPHLRRLPRIHLGTERENPVVLNRNDAKGTRGLWAQEQIYGYWDVTVAEAGRYDVTVHFEERVPGEGRLVLRAGPTQRTLVNADTTARTFTLRDVPLQGGDHMFESWYDYEGAMYLPFYAVVERRP